MGSLLNFQSIVNQSVIKVVGTELGTKKEKASERGFNYSLLYNGQIIVTEVLQR